MCKPEVFLYLLAKITDPYRLKDAIQVGIMDLFCHNRTDCIYPLLQVMESKTSLDNSRLKNMVIQQALRVAAMFNSEPWIKDLYNNPAITPEDYAGVLLMANGYKHEPLLQWLLASASFKDLQAVGERQNYSCSGREFYIALVETAMSTTPDKLRLSVAGPKYKMVRQTFDQGIDSPMPTVLIDIICSYVSEFDKDRDE